MISVLHLIYCSNRNDPATCSLFVTEGDDVLFCHNIDSCVLDRAFRETGSRPL